MVMQFHLLLARLRQHWSLMTCSRSDDWCFKASEHGHVILLLVPCYMDIVWKPNITKKSLGPVFTFPPMNLLFNERGCVDWPYPTISQHGDFDGPLHPSLLGFVSHGATEQTSVVSPLNMMLHWDAGGYLRMAIFIGYNWSIPCDCSSPKSKNHWWVIMNHPLTIFIRNIFRNITSPNINDITSPNSQL